MATKFWPAEVKAGIDRSGGRSVRQLTNHKCHSHHVDFGAGGFWDAGRKALFGSDRGGKTNLYSVDLQNGGIVQHTDGDLTPPPAETSVLFASVNPLKAEAYLWRGGLLMAVDLARNTERQLYKLEARSMGGQTSVTSDGKYVVVGVFENLGDRFPLDLLGTGAGVRELWEARPESRIVLVPVEGGAARDLFKERAWIGRVAANPTQPNVVLFAHEGPPEEVDQRMWGIDIRQGKPWPIRQRKSAKEAIEGEYWFTDGSTIGYHGRRADGKRFVGRVKYDGKDDLDVDVDQEVSHVASNDADLIVFTATNDTERRVRVWRWNGFQLEGPRVLCEHGASSNVRILRPRPRPSPDGRRVIFTSDRTGYAQLYDVEIGTFDTLGHD